MHFSLLSALTVAASILPALSVNAVGYSNTVSCSGDSAFVCGNLAEWACCGSFPSGYGYSVQFESLPAGVKGQGYSGGYCGPYIFTVYGPGTKCWNGGGSARTTNVNWFHDSSFAGRNVQRGIEAAAKANSTCVSPSHFRYTRPDGTQRNIRIPDHDGAAQKIADLHMSKDFDALSAYDHE